MLRPRNRGLVLSCWLLLAGLPAFSAAAPAPYLQAALYPVGSPPAGSTEGVVQLVAVDLNGDGRDDLIAASWVSSSSGPSVSGHISVLLANPDGSFSPALLTNTESPIQFIVQDFNGDGIPDIVLLSSSSTANDSISVFIGKGDGTFNAAVNYKLPGTSYGLVENENLQVLVAADVNGDGKPDLITFTNVSSQTLITVLLGNGNGTFQAPITSAAASSSPGKFVVGDFDNDGKPDIVASGGFISGSGATFLGNGDGTFQAPFPVGIGGGVLPLVVGDFNHDGKLDIRADDTSCNASAGYGFGSLATEFLGNGDGTFQSGTCTPSQAQVAADFNGDGIPDGVYFSDTLGTAGLEVWPSYLAASDQPVTFLTRLPGNLFGFGAPPGPLVAGNFRGNGKLGLAAAITADNHIAVLLGDGNGNFQAQQSYPSGASPGAIAVGDFNNDGFQDQLIANRGDNTITELLSRGNGTFRHFLITTGTNPQGIAVGDFNHDGNLDFAVTNANDNSVGVYLGDGKGNFAAPVPYAVGTDPRSIAVEDFNQDGKLDLVTVNKLSNTTSVLLGNGDGTFQSAITFSVNPGPIVNSPSSAITLSSTKNLSSRASASVSEREPRDNAFAFAFRHEQMSKSANEQIAAASSSLSSPREITVADLNDDGFPDLVVVNEGSNSVSVLLNDGSGHFPTATTYGVGSSPLSVAVGDLNSDGVPDLITANSGSNNMSVLLGKGDGTFTVGKVFSAGAGTTPAWVTLLSARNNGKLDAVVANSATNALSIFYGNGDGTFQQPPVSYTVGTQPQYSHTGNFSGGGTFDLASSNNLSNTINVLLNGGVAVAQLKSSSGTSTYGQSVTFTASVTPTNSGSPTPTGSFTFTDNNSPLATVQLNASGVATYSTAALTAGTHVIIATYSGDSRYFRNAASAVQTVLQATPTVNVNSTLNPSIYGQNVTLSISVSSSAGTPTGRVRITQGALLIGNPLLSNGNASLSSSTLTAGADNLQIAYSGDTNFFPASTNFAQTVNQAASSSQVFSSLNPSAVGQIVTFTARVLDASPMSTGNPTGAVTFFDGATNLGSGAIDPSFEQASLGVSSLAFGSHSITAVYNGDPNFLISTSPAITQNVLHATTTSVTSPGAITFGQQVTFTATVTSPDGGTPTGIVSFLDGNNPLGIAGLNGSGQAFFITPSNQPLSAGTHAITAIYEGDSNFVPSTSVVFNQTVNSVAGFSITSLTHTPQPIIHIGQLGQFTATLKNQSGSAVNNIIFSFNITGGRGYFVSGSFVVSSGASGACNISGQPLTCAIGTMNNGDTATVTITGVPTLAHALTATGSTNATTASQSDTVQVRFRPFKE